MRPAWPRLSGLLLPPTQTPASAGLFRQRAVAGRLATYRPSSMCSRPVRWSVTTTVPIIITAIVDAPNIRPIRPSAVLSAMARSNNFAKIAQIVTVQRAVAQAVPCPAAKAGQYRSAVAVRSVGGDFGGLYGLARQRIVGALIKLADAVAVEALLLDLKIGAEQQFRRQFLNGKADRFRRGGEAFVPDGAARFAAAAGK